MPYLACRERDPKTVEVELDVKYIEHETVEALFESLRGRGARAADVISLDLMFEPAVAWLWLLELEGVETHYVRLQNAHGCSFPIGTAEERKVLIASRCL